MSELDDRLIKLGDKIKDEGLEYIILVKKNLDQGIMVFDGSDSELMALAEGCVAELKKRLKK